MKRRVTFRVFGIPQSQGSMSAFVPKGWTRAIVTHKKGPRLKAWREAVALSVPKGKMLRGPVSVRIIFFMPIPKSRPKVLKTPLQVLEWKWPAKKPDLDKMVRAIYDALTGVVFNDDGQIVKSKEVKVYGEKPGAFVVVKELLKTERGKDNYEARQSARRRHIHKHGKGRR